MKIGGLQRWVGTTPAGPALTGDQGREISNGGQLSSGYVPTLDGWRAVAILAVIFHHATLALIPSCPWLRFSEQGAAGVDIFFALSGFLICLRLLEEIRRHGRINLKSFYARRAFRILPPYLAYMMALAVMACFGVVTLRTADWISCLTLTRNYLQAQFWSWTTGHFWSLSVENHFYLIFPAALALSGWKRMRNWLPFLLLAATSWRMLDYRFHLFDQLLPNVPFPYRTDIRLDEIAMGCLAALLTASPRVRHAIAQRLNSAAIIFLAVLLLFVTFRPVPGGILLQKLTIAALVMATALRSDLWTARWLEARWLRWLGRLSYSLYIWQQLFLWPTLTAVGSRHLQPWMTRLGIADNSVALRLLELPFLLGGALAMAMLSYYVVEQPALRWGRRLMAGRKPVAPSAPLTLPGLEPARRTA